MHDYLQPSPGPVVPGLEHHEAEFAKDQPQYEPIRALLSKTPEGRVLTRWTLTPQQREMVAAGADIFLELLTFGGRLQPIVMSISDRPPADYYAETYRLPLSKAGETQAPLRQADGDPVDTKLEFFVTDLISLAYIRWRVAKTIEGKDLGDDPLAWYGVANNLDPEDAAKCEDEYRRWLEWTERNYTSSAMTCSGCKSYPDGETGMAIIHTEKAPCYLAK